jgi:hypothetical protein
MAVDRQEERLITLVLDDGKETLELLLCEESGHQWREDSQNKLFQR